MSRRRSRLVLLLAAIALAAGVAAYSLSRRRGLLPVEAPAHWQVADLVEYLRVSGLPLRVVPAMREGDADLRRGTDLTETTLSWEELNHLPEAPSASTNGRAPCVASAKRSARNSVPGSRAVAWSSGRSPS
jgi:hypothetical protein